MIILCAIAVGTELIPTNVCAVSPAPSMGAKTLWTLDRENSTCVSFTFGIIWWFWLGANDPHGPAEHRFLQGLVPPLALVVAAVGLKTTFVAPAPQGES